MPPFQPSTPNSLKHKPLTHFSADRLIYASFCAPYILWITFPHTAIKMRLNLLQRLGLNTSITKNRDLLRLRLEL